MSYDDLSFYLGGHRPFRERGEGRESRRPRAPPIAPSALRLRRGGAEPRVPPARAPGAAPAGPELSSRLLVHVGPRREERAGLGAEAGAEGGRGGGGAAGRRSALPPGRCACGDASEGLRRPTVLLGAPHATARTKNNVQRYFGTNNTICSKKDEQPASMHEISKETESQESVKENTKKDLLGIIKGMKIELSTVNVQTTKPSSTRQLKSVEATINKLQKAPGDAPKKRTKSLSPELVAAASAIADFLPFDKQTTKSELLRQLQQHEEVSKAQKNGGRAKISVSNIISDMKVAKSATIRVSTRPVHQIQFDEGSDDYMSQKTSDVKKSLRKNMLKGKRLNIFDLKAVTEETSETETTPSLWDIEFAKQLAAVNEQPLQNGFAEMIQWTKDGKLWEFPINNEAGFDDEGSEFHEHIFLDIHLKDFPKQGPIRHFMELVTCGLSKNPYLSVKQKIEHIEWFRNYFNEKQDILKENGIEFN
uniref:Small ribosomal subunit protein mS31 n=2 Tax=Canis lupus familiaris TaxID=9615 RepID=A0A8C0RZR7_CANLF